MVLRKRILTRRDVLKSAATAAAGLVLAGMSTRDRAARADAESGTDVVFRLLGQGDMSDYNGETPSAYVVTGLSSYDGLIERWNPATDGFQVEGEGAVLGPDTQLIVFRGSVVSIQLIAPESLQIQVAGSPTYESVAFSTAEYYPYAFNDLSPTTITAYLDDGTAYEQAVPVSFGQVFPEQVTDFQFLDASSGGVITTRSLQLPNLAIA